jgi:hypothetical protein
VSLILEALRKLEKEKATADRGFVVLGSATWPAPVARRWPVVAAGAAVVLAAGAAWWMFQGERVEAPAAPAVAERQPAPATATLAPAPAATTLAPAVAPDVAPPVVAAPRPRPMTPADAAAPDLAPPATVALAPAPPAGATTAERRLQLQAITARDGRPIALVNDRLMGEGEEFEGIRIVAIRADEVEVEVDGRRRVLKF